MHWADSSMDLYLSADFNYWLSQVGISSNVKPVENMEWHVHSKGKCAPLCIFTKIQGFCLVLLAYLSC